MYHEPLVKLSKKLCDIAPGDYEKRVTFGLSGSDANDGIIKFACLYGTTLYYQLYKCLSWLYIWSVINVGYQFKYA